jgi:hypothetical protein
MKKKLFSVVGITTFASLSLSLSLSLSTSVNKTQDTALNSITKTSLTGIFEGNTNLGSFQTIPTLETILSRAKTPVPTLQNENIN